MSPAEPINPRERWNPTSIVMEAGASYRCKVTVKAPPGYADASMPCTPDGPTGFLGRIFNAVSRDATPWWNVFRWLGPGEVKRLRVLKDRAGREASFLTVIGCIEKPEPEDDLEKLRDHVFVIGSECTVKAWRSGQLHIFCNDWPSQAAYDNNKGNLDLTVERLSRD